MAFFLHPSLMINGIEIRSMFSVNNFPGRAGFYNLGLPSIMIFKASNHKLRSYYRGGLLFLEACVCLFAFLGFAGIGFDDDRSYDHDPPGLSYEYPLFTDITANAATEIVTFISSPIILPSQNKQEFLKRAPPA